MRIRTRLLFLGLSILIPAFLLCAVSIWFVYAEQKVAQEKSLRAAAKAFAMLVDKNFLAVQSQLYALSKSPELAAGDLRGFGEHARRLVPRADRVIVLSTVEGQQLLNTRASTTQLPRINASLLALRQQSPRQAVVSDLFIGGVAKRQDVAVDIPVEIVGQERYRLAMGFQASELQQLIQEQNFPAGWIATIVDRQGVIVARNDNPREFVGRRASAHMLGRILARETGGINYGTALDGRPVVAFFFRAPASGWTTVLSIPQSEMRRPAVYAAAFLTGILLVLLCIALGVASYYARKTVAPIEYLRSTAELLGKGAAISLRPTGLAEADLIGQALFNASAVVKQHNEVLEQRVAEAVATSEVAQRALLQAQKLEALGRLTGGVAHDFNNILQTISSCLQVMRMTKDQVRIAALIDTGEKAIRRATELTAQMRSFARVQDVRLETVHLGDAVEAIRPLLHSSLHQNIVLRIHAAVGLWHVTIDRLQFELALLNVVINARDAMPRGGEVVLQLRNETITSANQGIGPGDFVVVTISDQGVGIPRELLSKVLDPFFTTKSVNEGSGLGLPQAYGFAAQAGGTLLLDSVEGAGTTVTIYLPRSHQAPIVATAARSAPITQASCGVLLFVEDDALVRDTVGTALEHAGFDVIRAASADEALTVLESGRRVDVVFSDVVMPGKLNGVDLARTVLATYPALPIVLASGHADVAIDLDNVKLIGKPYDVVNVVNLLIDAQVPA